MVAPLMFARLHNHSPLLTMVPAKFLEQGATPFCKAGPQRGCCLDLAWEEKDQGGSSPPFCMEGPRGTLLGNFKNFAVSWCSFIMAFESNKNKKISSNDLITGTG